MTMMETDYDQDLHDRIAGLSDLELAFLLCLINKEHCIVSTQPSALDDLVQELKLISTKTFGLAPLTISCTPHTTLDDLAASIIHPAAQAQYQHQHPHQHHSQQHHHHHSTPPTLTTSQPTRTSSPLHPRLQPQEPSSYFPTVVGALTPIPVGASAFSPALGSSAFGAGATTAPAPAGGQIANVILARNLDHAPRAVQVQVLELLRTRRIFTRTAVQTAPRPFLLVAVLSDAPVPTEASGYARVGGGQSRGGGARVGMGTAKVAPRPSMTGLVPHLNDHFFIAHRHDGQLDGFANLDEEWARTQDNSNNNNGDNDANDADSISAASVLRKSAMATEPEEALFSEDDVAHLASLSEGVSVDIEVVRYQMNVVAFLRMNRAVAGGISPVATKHLEQLMRSLAPLNRISFVTPALVDLAVRKIYLHRIRIVAPEKERSVQWGSDVVAVRELLDGVGADEVLDQVLSLVKAPV